MNTKISLQTVLIVLLLSILIFVSSDSNVIGQTGTIDPLFPVNPAGSQSVIEGTGIVPGGPGFIMINPYAFKPVISSYEYAYTGSGLYNPSITSVSGFVAGLTLPHQAALTKLTLYFKDSSVSSDMSAVLYRSDGEANLYSVAYLFPTGEAAAYRYLSTTDIINAVVDNQNYSYFLWVGFPANVGSSIVLANLRIDYEYTANLPLVTK